MGKRMEIDNMGVKWLSLVTQLVINLDYLYRKRLKPDKHVSRSLRNVSF